jgi:Zn-dependent peptidase ImmA (M78 family)
MQKGNSSFLDDFRKLEIETLADYLADYYFSKGAINPEIIADDSNITYTYGEYADSFDGLLEHAFGKFHIYINTDRLGHGYTERARFTFAHELGHYYIDEHRNALASGLSPSHSSFTGFVSDNLAEREADFFASCLLLPIKKIRQDCFRRPFKYSLIQELAKKYQTSMTATALRYASIGMHPIMVVYSVNAIIEWYFFTKDFPFWSLKYGKSKVPEDTAAGEFFYLSRKYSSTESVYAEDWFNVKYDKDYKRAFHEHCLYGRNNSVLSLIWED